MLRVDRVKKENKIAILLLLTYSQSYHRILNSKTVELGSTSTDL